GGIAPHRHHDAPDAWDVVPGVKGVPAIAQVNFEPAAEIHRQNDRHADISHVAGDVTCRDVQAPAKSEREMAEIAANSFAALVNIEGRFGGIGEVIAEGDVFVHPGADGL